MEERFYEEVKKVSYPFLVGYEKDLFIRIKERKVDERYILGCLLQMRNCWTLCKLYIDTILENVNGPCTYGGDTPLLVAVMVDSEKAVEYLLKKGAKVDCCRLSSGETPLHLVTSISLANILIKAGSKPYSQDFEGRIPWIVKNYSKLLDI